MIRELITRNRSYRRFKEFKIEPDVLKDLVDLARISSSAANLQPLKYILSCDPKRNAMIFPLLTWAAYLRDWPGPREGEKPSAYIIVLGDTRIGGSFELDCGIACQSILLGAAEKGLGGCIIGSIQRKKLREVLQIPDYFEIVVIIALGRPGEEISLEEISGNGDIRYWRDDKNIHHVPKRSLDEILIG